MRRTRFNPGPGEPGQGPKLEVMTARDEEEAVFVLQRTKRRASFERRELAEAKKTNKMKSKITLATINWGRT